MVSFLKIATIWVAINSSIGLTTEVHPFHLSKTIIEYSNKSKTLQLSTHIFLDDLEESILTSTGEDINYQTPNQHPKADSLIYTYVKSQMYLTDQGETIALNEIGSELSEDKLAIWIYFESDSLAIGDHHMKMRNSLLMKSFSDQKNVVNVNIQEKSFYFLFAKISQEEIIEFSCNL